MMSAKDIENGIKSLEGDRLKKLENVKVRDKFDFIYGTKAS